MLPDCEIHIQPFSLELLTLPVLESWSRVSLFLFERSRRESVLASLVMKRREFVLYFAGGRTGEAQSADEGHGAAAAADRGQPAGRVAAVGGEAVTAAVPRARGRRPVQPPQRRQAARAVSQVHHHHPLSR